MKRSLVCATAAVITLSTGAMAGVTSAVAAGSRAIQSTSGGLLAIATWNYQPDAATLVNGVAFADGGPANDPTSSNGEHAAFLAEISVWNLDASGARTGGVDVRIFDSVAKSVSVDPQLSSAHALGTDVPSLTCEFGANGLFTHCAETTTSYDITWVGQGEIARGDLLQQHIRDWGVVLNTNLAGAERYAPASGTYGELTLPTTFGPDREGGRHRGDCLHWQARLIIPDEPTYEYESLPGSGDLRNRSGSSVRFRHGVSVNWVPRYGSGGVGRLRRRRLARVRTPTAVRPGRRTSGRRARSESAGASTG